jgi:hypothetical protein
MRGAEIADATSESVAPTTHTADDPDGTSIHHLNIARGTWWTETGAGAGAGWLTGKVVRMDKKSGVPDRWVVTWDVDEWTTWTDLNQSDYGTDREQAQRYVRCSRRWTGVCTRGMLLLFAPLLVLNVT